MCWGQTRQRHLLLLHCDTVEIGNSCLSINLFTWNISQTQKCISYVFILINSGTTVICNLPLPLHTLRSTPCWWSSQQISHQLRYSKAVWRRFARTSRLFFCGAQTNHTSATMIQVVIKFCLFPKTADVFVIGKMTGNNILISATDFKWLITNRFHDIHCLPPRSARTRCSTEPGVMV